ncbi:LOW QUALITY PROTEIN: flavin-containing monooxygenase 5-like [Liolophura sinensis]|uniref:LOW QUALITY PROTEIN: flavin-containing monooxygenase 5-like n=1 Tax=Liolophura sinensis TaxID=3198878 RepID=UPI003159777F
MATGDVSNNQNRPITKVDVVVIGAGISGLATAKCLREAGFKVTVLERTGEVGGLWTFRENDYGVMRFTHINVSKHNYCFSDFPFPEHAPDYPHHSDMAQYIRDYTSHFKISELIQFQTKVIDLEKKDSGWQITAVKVDETGERVTPKGEEEIYQAKFVAIATGHHAIPRYPKFPGENTFKGEIIHSVKFKDAITNGMVGKRVLVVGIGNSAVDAACNAVSEGRCKSVYISTRSGAWVVPNYVFGCPTDHYACRFFLALPWKLGSFIFESIIRLLNGDPKKWKLNPKMRLLQTQPTVSPTLIHHIQRHQIRVVPNIVKIDGQSVQFVDGQTAEFDHIIYCTGYKICLPYLNEELHKTVIDTETNQIKLYKNMFSPAIGSSLAFIGFVQPASGGVLTMSEMQAMWFAELCRGKVRLPNQITMTEDMKKEEEWSAERYYHSARHTIQKDPIVYNDDIAQMIGAKPEVWKHPALALNLLFGSCGAAQWRLQGPFKWSRAAEVVRNVPVTPMMHYISMLLVVFLLMALYMMLKVVCKIFC